MKKLITLLFAIPFYIFLFPITALVIIIGPLVTISDLSDVFKYSVPKLPLTFPGLFLIGFILFLSMKVDTLKWIYKKFPVLLPTVQMGFLMLFALQVGLEFSNLWADNNVYPREIALVLALLSFVVGRIFLSYWYYKYPISYKIHK
jgi:hypothetical protein